MDSKVSYENIMDIIEPTFSKDYLRSFPPTLDSDREMIYLEYTNINLKQYIRKRKDEFIEKGDDIESIKAGLKYIYEEINEKTTEFMKEKGYSTKQITEINPAQLEAKIKKKSILSLLGIQKRPTLFFSFEEKDDKVRIYLKDTEKIAEEKMINYIADNIPLETIIGYGKLLLELQTPACN